jgi:hypothetical protein
VYSWSKRKREITIPVHFNLSKTRDCLIDSGLFSPRALFGRSDENWGDLNFLLVAISCSSNHWTDSIIFLTSLYPCKKTEAGSGAEGNSVLAPTTTVSLGSMEIFHGFCLLLQSGKNTHPHIWNPRAFTSAFLEFSTLNNTVIHPRIFGILMSRCTDPALHRGPWEGSERMRIQNNSSHNRPHWVGTTLYRYQILP